MILLELDFLSTLDIGQNQLNITGFWKFQGRNWKTPSILSEKISMKKYFLSPSKSRFSEEKEEEKKFFFEYVVIQGSEVEIRKK